MKKLSIILGVIIALLFSSCAIHTQHPSQMNRHNRHYSGHYKKPKKHYKYNNSHRGKKKGHFKRHRRYGYIQNHMPTNHNTAGQHFHYGSI